VTADMSHCSVSLAPGFLRQPPDQRHQPAIKGDRVPRQVTGGERKLVGMHVRRLLPAPRQRPGRAGRRSGPDVGGSTASTPAGSRWFACC
jgi:hypothetical protein